MHSTDSRLHRSANARALNCTHLKKFVVDSNTSNGDQAVHPAPRSCRGNGACATGRPLQTPGLLQVPVCQTISRNQCGHLHLAGNLVAMSATHSTNQVITRCWLGTLPLRLRSTSVSLSKPLNNFTQISSEPLFSEAW